MENRSEYYKGVHYLIEDFQTSTCYTSMKREDYHRTDTRNLIKFAGTHKECWEWAKENPHPEAEDTDNYFLGDLKSYLDATKQ